MVYMKETLIFGNGRSLKGYDFKSIDREKYFWVGATLAFRHWNSIDSHPDVYVNVDKVVCKNPEVIQYVKDKKCSLYILSNSIKESYECNHRTDIHFIEELMAQGTAFFKFMNNYCSGSSAVITALSFLNCDTYHLMGFDCDYIEFLPECEKLEDGTLRITKTPKHNPNYFTDDYQRKGDIYNVPNGKRVHLQSWKELSYIMEFFNKMYECNKTLVNYNNKVSVGEYITQKPLQDMPQTAIKNRESGTKRIAFLVPTTSNMREWESISESYLVRFLLPTIEKLNNDFDVEVYIGYDDDDKLFSKINLPSELSLNGITLKWFPFCKDYKGKPTHIWNKLSEYAMNDGHEYFQVCGDDIVFDNRIEWLGIFLKMLKKNNNIGYSAGYSNNTEIPTQFLIHKKHIDMFGWIFPPQIHAWYCDNFMYELYGKKYGNWIKEYRHLNVGGQPRYNPKNDKALCNMLVKRHKTKLNRIIYK